MDESDVVGEEVCVPLRVNDPTVGGDLHPVVRGVPDVHRAQHDVKVGGAVNAVGRGEEVGGGDESSSTEPGAVNEESSGPGKLSLLCCFSSDDERRDSSCWSLHPAVSHLLLLLSSISLEDPPPHLCLVLPLPGAEPHPSMTRLILTEVPSSCRPPDLLRS